MSKQPVFLSYSHRDREVGARFDAALRQLGVRAFNPQREIPAGADWRKSILEAIKQAEAMVFLVVSPQAASSSWMAYEAGIAEALGKSIVVLMPSRYPVTSLPADFSVGQVLDFDSQKPERAAREIVDRLVAA